MAFFSKTPARRFDGGDVITIVGPEAYFHGVITVRGSLRVEGEVEGSIHEANTVIVGDNGRIQGDIAAEHVVIGGTVRGDIVATVELEIIAGGKVTGNIRTAKLMIEEGAVFEGNCVMTGGEDAASVKKSSEHDRIDEKDNGEPEAKKPDRAEKAQETEPVKS